MEFPSKQKKKYTYVDRKKFHLHVKQALNEMAVSDFPTKVAVGHFWPVPTFRRSLLLSEKSRISTEKRHSAFVSKMKTICVVV